MNQLSMRAKFIALTVSIIVVFLVALALIKSKSVALADSFDRFYNENHAVSIGLERIKERQVDIVLNVRGLQIGYLLSLDKQIPGYLDTINKAYDQTPALFDQLRRGYAGEKEALNTLEALVTDFENKTKVFVKAMQDAPDNKAPFPVFSAFITSYNVLMEEFASFSAKNNIAVSAAKQRAEHLMTEIDASFWISIAISLMISLALSYVISNNIVRGILSVRNAAQEVAEGYLNKPVSVVGTDEIAELGHAINTSTENLRSVINSVMASVDAVNKNSQGVLKANQAAGERSLEIMNNTEQVAVALDEVSTSNRSISELTQHSAEAANEIRGVAETSLSTANNTLGAINDLLSTLKDTNTAVTELRSETSNIETILGVIRGISEQTNLLALNAAIEAARAGETGRGFAVVADEVRALAQRSQDSVNEIEALLLKLNDASHRAVDQMDASLELMETSRSYVTQTNELTGNILERIENISEQASQIASSAVQQISVSEEISEKMHSVRDLTQSNAEETRSSGQDMANSSVDVKKQLSFFKL